MTMKNDAKFENELTWLVEFDELSPKYSKISKICTLMGCKVYKV